MEIEVRDERPEDVAAIRALHELAFGQREEAVLVDALRDHGAATLSLVADRGGEVVGHVLYSPVTIGDALEGAGLGPVSVLPRHQGRGIGSLLIRAGNERLERAGSPFIVVLGHVAYYPRFGFRPASERGVRCEWKVPGDAFMLLVLDERRMRGASGTARYRPEFSAVV